MGPSQAPRRLFAHLPFSLWRRYLPLLKELQVSPEVAFSAADLDPFPDRELNSLREALAETGGPVVLHAPYMDLNPGALDPLVKKATSARFSATIRAAVLLGGEKVIFHPGYERWRYGWQMRPWLEANLAFWPPLLDQAEITGCHILLENIFEQNPYPLAHLLHRLDHPLFGHCFDIGHWRLFSPYSLDEWFALLGEKLSHCHIHDNHGDRDAHLPVGEGAIDFPHLLALLDRLPQEVTLTLEAHTPEALRRSWTATRSLFSS